MATEYDAIRVSEDAKDEAAAAKGADETWNEYVRRCAENPPRPIEVVAIDDLDGMLGDLSIDLDDVESDSDLSADDVAAAAERGVERALQNAGMA